jgi:hypothetical protein
MLFRRLEDRDKRYLHASAYREYNMEKSGYGVRAIAMTRWWRVGGGLTQGALCLALMASCAGDDGGSDVSAQSVPAAIADQLRAAVVTAAENDLTFRGNVTSHADRIGCAAAVFGVDPENATTISDVRVVYAHVHCAGVTATGDLSSAEALAIPVAVTLPSPAGIVAPGDGDQYARDLHRIFPERLWKQAAAGSHDPAALDAQLQDRLTQLVEQGPT